MSFARPWLLLLLLGARRSGGGAAAGGDVPAARYSDVTLPAAVSAPAAGGSRCRRCSARWRSRRSILAAAGPRIGGDTVEMKQEGIAIVIAIDISSSMLAEDFAPSNRLEVAKRQAVGFIRGRTADRIGLVAFAGEALTQVPVTLDYPVVEQAVMDLKIGSLEDGTAIGSGLATAVNRLRRAPDKSKVILLLTDGENNKGLIDPAHRGGDGRGVRHQGLHHRRRHHRRGADPDRPRARRLPLRAAAGADRRAAAPGDRGRRPAAATSAPSDSEALSRIFRQIDAAGEDADPGDPLHPLRRGHPAAHPARARRAGAGAAARQHAGGAGPMTFDAPLLLFLAPVVGACLGFAAWLARRRRIRLARRWSPVAGHALARGPRRLGPAGPRARSALLRDGGARGSALGRTRGHAPRPAR